MIEVITAILNFIIVTIPNAIANTIRWGQENLLAVILIIIIGLLIKPFIKWIMGWFA